MDVVCCDIYAILLDCFDMSTMVNICTSLSILDTVTLCLDEAGIPIDASGLRGGGAPSQPGFDPCLGRIMGVSPLLIKNRGPPSPLGSKKHLQTNLSYSM
jgi:hypothetical protein